MGFKRIPNGKYFYFNRSSHTILLVKAGGGENSCRVLNMSVPKELFGKKVRLKLIVVGDILHNKNEKD